MKTLSLVRNKKILQNLLKISPVLIVAACSIGESIVIGNYTASKVNVTLTPVGGSATTESYVYQQAYPCTFTAKNQYCVITFNIESIAPSAYFVQESSATNAIGNNNYTLQQSACTSTATSGNIACTYNFKYTAGGTSGLAYQFPITLNGNGGKTVMAYIKLNN